MRTRILLSLVVATSLAAACEKSTTPIAGPGELGPAPAGPLTGAFLPLPITSDDDWDVSSGVTVDGTSGLLFPSTRPAENIFGAGGSTLFSDVRPAGTVHWVEWSAPEARAIERFVLVGSHDSHITINPPPQCRLPFPYTRNRDANHRGFDHFTLKAWNPATSAFDLVLYDADVPLGDDDHVHPGEGAKLFDPDKVYSAGQQILVLESAVPVVSTTRWRAEVRQVGCPSAESGPRIRELDGFVSEVLAVEIDIKPGGDPNSVNCRAGHKGVIPVAILSTEDFDATTVDHSTVRFAGAAETHTRKDEAKRHEEDVDGDGDVDLVFHFRFDETDLDCDSTEALLTGETFDGTPIEGSGPVRMVGGR